jgi:hypothetical protein
VLRVEGGRAERAKGKQISRHKRREGLRARATRANFSGVKAEVRASSEVFCAPRVKAFVAVEKSSACVCSGGNRRPESRTSQDGLDNVTTVELSDLTNYTSISAEWESARACSASVQSDEMVVMWNMNWKENSFCCFDCQKPQQCNW